jgi:hypothetical protein
MRRVSQILQKVFAAAASAGGDGSAVVWDGAEYLEFLLQVFAEVHDGGDVAAAIAVVGGGPDSHDVFVLEVVLGERQDIEDWVRRGEWTYLVTLVDELMGSCDELKAVDVVELRLLVGIGVCRKAEGCAPPRRLCLQTANRHHEEKQPMSRLPRGHSRPGRRRLLRGEFPVLGQRRGSGLMFGSPGSVRRVRREPCRRQ